MKKGMASRSLVVAVFLTLSACTIPLPEVIARPDVSSRQLQTDINDCKDHAEAKTSGTKFVAAVLSASIVGAPAGYNMERSALRSAYAECMSSRDYTVLDF